MTGMLKLEDELLSMKGVLSDPLLVVCVTKIEETDGGRIVAKITSKQLRQYWDKYDLFALRMHTLFYENKEKKEFWASNVLSHIEEKPDKTYNVYFNSTLGESLFQLQKRLLSELDMYGKIELQWGVIYKSGAIEIRIDKKAVFEKLFRLIGDELKREIKEDGNLKNDILLLSDDTSPIFRFLNSDQYSAIDIIADAPGAYAIQYFLDKYSTDREYNAEIVRLMLSLVLNRELTMRERRIAEDATTLCNYADNRCDAMMDCIDKIIAKNAWAPYYLRPIYVCLFLFNALMEEREAFWDEVQMVFDEEIKTVRVIDRYRIK